MLYADALQGAVDSGLGRASKGGGAIVARKGLVFHEKVAEAEK